MTDDNMEYRRINYSYKNESVTHSLGEYVSGECHTNNIESFWSIIIMSKKHLQRFVNEFVFRYNNKDKKGFTTIRFERSLLNINHRLPY